ncbi:CRISPR-associated helicase Cas3' [Streptomyces sedi]|uniref:CRISPR-associated helicase Cas3 n=1 Tax=Streptomyces sedi TaxID=555059 RepID=A0A5C4UU17_9ACTN|nr:CRISPR-associated helicase Cas3' [Streptomyces sedi]TNM27062.1 CRISPR-associated helicase Cas3' [Streptomyces sedi]
MMPPPVDHRLWAKWSGVEDLGPYPVPCHLIDTAMAAMELWEHYLAPGQRRAIAQGWGVTDQHARALTGFWAGLHDLGKLCPSFQHSQPDAAGSLPHDSAYPTPAGWHQQEPLRHERVTHLTLPALLHTRGYPGAGNRPKRSLAHQIAQILGGHHGRYGTALTSEQLADPHRHEQRVGNRSWAEQREATVELLHQLCGQPSPPARFGTPAAAVLTTGVVILADWLVSQRSWVRARLRQRLSTPDAERDDWSRHAARARQALPGLLDKAQLRQPTWKPETTFAGLFPQITQPYPLQADIDAHLPALVHGPGLVIVTAPTGDGKTESGLLAARLLGHASGTPGLGTFLPTMATTDAMHRRKRRFADRTLKDPTPVARLHSLAWLDDHTDDDTSLTKREIALIVGEWLRGRHRGLLAGIATGTWDTAALAALPLRFNAMRWLGLTGKTIIIDEAHAYDAYGHHLTARLLQWLGHCRVPVVLLSATLTGRIATQLAHAYRTGAGHTAPTTIQPTYPGWTHIDATTGTVTTSPTLPSTRARDLRIHLTHVTHTHNPTTPGGRAHTLLAALQPLTNSGEGTALIVCNTVADAQQTANLLRNHLNGAHPPLIQLLHARFPQRQREGITRRVLRWASPPDDKDPAARRPARPVIVIATQVIEQSLDVDFDHVITDLAPIALLLQRAGRCQRHDRDRRPDWAPTPALTVLVPTGQLPPRRWGSVYSGNLLDRTLTALRQLPNATCRIPHDVQQLVDNVYTHDWTTPAGLERAATEHAMESIAETNTIPPPTDALRDLHPLTTTDDEDALTTRLGADSIRVLPVYTDPDGNHWLDRTTRHQPLPHTVHPTDKPTIRRLMHKTIPINLDTLQRTGTPTHTPPGWTTTGALRDIHLLPQPTTNTCTATHHLDPLNGLVSTGDTFSKGMAKRL